MGALQDDAEIHNDAEDKEARRDSAKAPAEPCFQVRVRRDEPKMMEEWDDCDMTIGEEAEAESPCVCV